MSSSFSRRSLRPCLALGLLLSIFGSPALAQSKEAKPSSAKPTDSAYARYTKFAKEHGVKQHRSRALVIGLRGRDIEGKLHKTRIRSAYNDTLIILTRDGRVIEYRASTHPWELEAPGIPDVDGDGKADVGMIRPGSYVALRRPDNRNIGGEPTYHLLTRSGSGKVPGYRNTDQDDVFSKAEQQASKKRGDTMTAVLFHREGGEDDPRPVGCQIVEAERMGEFADEVGERFDYWLVDVSEGLPKSLEP